MASEIMACFEAGQNRRKRLRMAQARPRNRWTSAVERHVAPVLSTTLIRIRLRPRHWEDLRARLASMIFGIWQSSIMPAIRISTNPLSTIMPFQSLSSPNYRRSTVLFRCERLRKSACNPERNGFLGRNSRRRSNAPGDLDGCRPVHWELSHSRLERCSKLIENRANLD